MTTSSSPDRREWFYSREGRICGSPAPGDLAELLETQAIPSDSLVWCQGMAEWQGAAQAIASGAPPAQAEGAKPAPWLPPVLPADAQVAVRSDIRPGPLRPARSSLARASYLAAHWRGEHSLARSFWLNHMLIAGAATSVLFAAIGWANRRLGERPVPLLALVLTVLTLVLLVQAWEIVGTWRAARRSRSVLGRPVRAWIVRALLRLDAVGTVSLLIGAVVPHAGAALSGMPFALPGATVRDQGRRVDFSGPITLASPAEFRRALAAAPSARLVRLSSAGGVVVAAREVARAIRIASLDTEVVQDCASACTLVFFSGRHRTLHDGARLGFHSYSSPAMTPQAVVAEEEIERQAYQAAGLPPAFVDRIFSVPPNGVWYPPRPALIAAGFATDDTPGRAPADGPPAVRIGTTLPPSARSQQPTPVIALAPGAGTQFPGAGRPGSRPLEPLRPDAVARRTPVSGKGA